MAPFLFLLLIIFCVLEFMTFAFLASSMGFGALTTLVFLTAGLGLSLAYGKMDVFKAENWFEEHEPLLKKIMVAENALIATSGLLLLVPGFLSDTLGFLLLASSVRRATASAMIEASKRLHKQQSKAEDAGEDAEKSNRHPKALTKYASRDPFVNEECRQRDTNIPPEYNAYGKMTNAFVYDQTPEGGSHDIIA